MRCAGPIQRVAREGENPDADRHWFWDVMSRRPIEIEYPTMLEFPPSAHGYPKETVVAEEDRGPHRSRLLKSRIKTTTTRLLARLYPFDALSGRGHSITFDIVAPQSTRPQWVDRSFLRRPRRAVQWRAFVRRSRFESESGLDEIVGKCGASPQRH